MMTLSECLNAAANLIEQKGWVQGDWHVMPNYELEQRGGYCMIGAIREVCPETYMRDRSGIARTHITEPLGFPGVDWAIIWNDAPERTKEQVVTRLRLGAERAAVAEPTIK